MIGCVHVDVYHLHVGVFDSEKSRIKFLRKKGVKDLMRVSESAFASAHMDHGGGTTWFSVVMKPRATLATLAHECSHMADFIVHHLGIPLTVECTEVRAYLVGFLFCEVQKIIGERA